MYAIDKWRRWHSQACISPPHYTSYEMSRNRNGAGTNSLRMSTLRLLTPLRNRKLVEVLKNRNEKAFKVTKTDACQTWDSITIARYILVYPHNRTHATDKDLRLLYRCLKYSVIRYLPACSRFQSAFIPQFCCIIESWCSIYQVLIRALYLQKRSLIFRQEWHV